MIKDHRAYAFLTMFKLIKLAPLRSAIQVKDVMQTIFWLPALIIGQKNDVLSAHPGELEPDQIPTQDPLRKRTLVCSLNLR